MDGDPGRRLSGAGRHGHDRKQRVEQAATAEDTHDHHDIGGGAPKRTACDGVGTGRSVRASRKFNNLVRALAVSGLD